jgi:sugar lactone lactonase YvrE
MLAATIGILLAAGSLVRAEQPCPPKQQPELLVTMPDYVNTPDGMCLLPDGNVIVCCPNINDQTQPAVLMKITPDNQLELFYRPPAHPDTGKAYPFGICVGPGGDLYYADLQWFADPENPNYKSRVMRIPMEDGKPGEAVVFASGMVVANAVAVRGGYLYVSDTIMVPGTDPLITGVFRFRLDEEGVALKQPLQEDPHLLVTTETKNVAIGFGADGLTFDSRGNLYIADFADGVIRRVTFDREMQPSKPRMFAKAPFMKSCDGIFCDVTTDKIYVADSMANAVQLVYPDGRVCTLAQQPESDGTGGRLDQPCEVLIRGDEILISNFDFPVPGGVNTKFEVPNTICTIPLD